MRAQQANMVFYVGSFQRISGNELACRMVSSARGATRHLAILKESSDLDVANF